MKFCGCEVLVVLAAMCSLLDVVVAAETPISTIADLESPPFYQQIHSRQTSVYRIGDNITLPCQVHGNPPPVIEWYRKSAANNDERSLSSLSSTNPETSQLALLASEMQLIATSDQLQAQSALNRYVTVAGIGSLFILRAELADAGRYQCVARNRFGTTVSIAQEVAFVENAQFQFDSPTVLEAAVGDSVVLNCRFPHSFPAPVRYWSVFDESNPFSSRAVSESGGKSNNNNRNPRITMDYDGNLYFTHLQPEDYNSGAQRYVSNQYQKDIRSSYHGCDHVIKSALASTSQREGSFGGSRVLTGVLTRLLYASPSAVVVEENSPVRMKCIFGGYPTPIVEWYRLSVDGVARRLSEAQEFSLANAREPDAGNYYCMPRGENALKRSFNLQVVFAPRFVVPLRYTVVDEHETIDLRCAAVGRPEPVVLEWYINGERITPQSDNRRYSFTFVDSTHIRIYNMTRDRMCSVQCNASNSVGYALSEAAIIVTNRAPIINKPLTDAVYVEQSNVTLVCEALSPAVTVSWYKDNQLIDRSLERVSINRATLAITAISKLDAGTYKCVLSNKFGSTDSSATITVKKRTLAIVSQSTVTRRETEDARFVCSYIVDPTEVARVEWKKGDRMLPSDSRFVVLYDNAKSTLHITRTMLADTGNYHCQVRTSADAGIATAQLFVQAHPNAPIFVAVQCSATTKEARVSWQSGGHNNAEITGYLVEYATPLVGSWQRMRNVTAMSGNIQSTTLRLGPWMNYTFRVIASNAIGVSQPSEPTSDTCATPAERPARNPDGVIVHGVLEGTITVSWSPLQLEELGGPDFSYRVRVSCDLDPEIQQAVLYADANITDFSRSTITLSEMVFLNGTVTRVPTYRRCRAMVSSVNALGDSGSAPQRHEGYSGESVPLVVPQRIEVDTTLNGEPNSIALVIWPPADTSVDAIRGCWTGYQVVWWDSRVPAFSSQKLVNASFGSCHESLHNIAQRPQIRAVIPQIPGMINITLVVAVTTRYYTGPWSAPVVYTTPEGVPSKCEEFMEEEVGATFVRLKWMKPAVANGRILGYKLGYSTTDTRGRWGTVHVATTINDPEMWAGSISRLAANTTYRIFVWAFTARGMGENSSIEIRTLEVASRSTKITFDVTVLNESAVNVTVNLPSSIDFYVQYRALGRTLWQSSLVESGKRWRLINGLNRFLQYEFRVYVLSATLDDVGSEISIVSMNVMEKNPFTFSSLIWLVGFAVLIVILLIILTIVCFRKKKSRVDENKKLTPLLNGGNAATNGRFMETYQETQLTHLLNEADCQSIPSPYHHHHHHQHYNHYHHPNNVGNNNNNVMNLNGSNCSQQVRDSYSNASTFDTNSVGLCGTLRPPSRQTTPKRQTDTLRSGAVSFSKLSGVECDV